MQGWSLNTALWEDFRSTMNVLNWNRVYLERSYRFKVPATAGVYLICASAQNADNCLVMERLYNVLYAGKSTNLQRRFEQHAAGSRQVTNIRRIFRRPEFYFALVDSSELDEVEDLVLKTLGPVENKRHAIAASVGEPIPIGIQRRGVL